MKAIKRKYALGSIVAIPLPDGRFAYAKVFNDSNFGIYDVVSKEILPMDAVYPPLLCSTKRVPIRQ